jgi:hypothetical protein
MESRFAGALLRCAGWGSHKFPIRFYFNVRGFLERVYAVASQLGFKLGAETTVDGDFGSGKLTALSRLAKTEGLSHGIFWRVCIGWWEVRSQADGLGASIFRGRNACDDGVLLLSARREDCVVKSLGRLRSTAGATLGLGPAWSLLGDDRGWSLGHLGGAGRGLRRLLAGR